MKNTCARYVCLLFVLLASAPAMPSSLASQTGSGGVLFTREAGRIPITITMAEGTGGPKILRRTSEPRNIILINATVTESQLEAAIFALLVAEARDPQGHERDDNAAVQVNLPQSSPRYPGARAVIQRIRNAPRGALRGLSSGAQSVEIWVAPRRGRHR